MSFLAETGPVAPERIGEVCGGDVDPITLDPVTYPAYRVGKTCYDAHNLAAWLTQIDNKGDYRNADTINRTRSFTASERADIFKAAGVADPRLNAEFLRLTDLAMHGDAPAFRRRLEDMGPELRGAVLRHALMPGRITLLMFTAVELRWECMLIVLRYCADPAYVNAVDARGHNALTSVFYWYMRHAWEWDANVEAVALTLLGTPGVDTSGAVALLEGMLEWKALDADKIAVIDACLGIIKKYNI